MNNRELGLLRFNERVLDLASDPNVPLLERLRYLCISASNLDEFFEIRVAGTRQKVMAGVESAGIDGLSPLQELKLVTERAHALISRQYDLLNHTLLPALAEEDIRFYRRDDWSDELQAWVKALFERDIAPILSPLGVPRSLPRIIPVPSDIGGAEHGFVFLSSVIHANVDTLFNGMSPIGVFQFKVTRNSDLYVSEEDVANLKRAVENELLQRAFGQAVRLEIDANCTDKIVKYLQKHYKLHDEEVYRVTGPVNLNRLISMPDQIDRRSIEPDVTAQS